MATSKIEWTEASWNPLTGCSKISSGCKNCYAERMSKRLKAMGNKHYEKGFELTLHQDALSIPLMWKSPRLVFVNSMSDIFHENVPIDFIQKVFDTMALAKHHTFQILTKRSERLLELSSRLLWCPNIWMGVSVEDADNIFRIKHLQATGAAVKFLSCEPLIGALGTLDLSNINWVIVGGESGPGARPMEEEWVTGIRDQCLKNKIPFFFKQWGGKNKKKAGRLLKGKLWNEMPDRDK